MVFISTCLFFVRLVFSSFDLSTFSPPVPFGRHFHFSPIIRTTIPYIPSARTRPSLLLFMRGVGDSTLSLACARITANTHTQRPTATQLLTLCGVWSLKSQRATYVESFSHARQYTKSAPAWNITITVHTYTQFANERARLGVSGRFAVISMALKQLVKYQSSTDLHGDRTQFSFALQINFVFQNEFISHFAEVIRCGNG